MTSSVGRLIYCFQWVFLLFLALSLNPPELVAKPVKFYIHAAASTTDVMRAVVTAYHPVAKTAGFSIEPIFNFAASSTLARHIEAGAPADFFLSANQAWMDYLLKRGLISPSHAGPLLQNRLVLIAPRARSFDASERIDSQRLDAWLGQKGKLVMGDPAHVPVGIYGLQALQKLGLWNGLQGRLAFAKSARDTLNFVIRNETPLALTYATDARFHDAAEIVHSIDKAAHDPILYAAGIPVDAPNAAIGAHFFRYLHGSTAKTVFEKFGFGVPK